MVKHLVFFKLSTVASKETRHAELRKMEEIFSPLGRKLSYIEEFRTGINFNKSAHAWDFAIDSVFKSRDDLIRYQESAEHLEAIREASHIEKSKAVIDYEF
jgi:molybdenum cofactor biosynthesis enzyme MoaA